MQVAESRRFSHSRFIFDNLLNFIVIPLWVILLIYVVHLIFMRIHPDVFLLALFYILILLFDFLLYESRLIFFFDGYIFQIDLLDLIIQVDLMFLRIYVFLYIKQLPLWKYYLLFGQILLHLRKWKIFDVRLNGF